MKKRRAKTTPNKASAQNSQPFLVHFRELRRRLAFIAVSVFIGGAVAYGLEQHIIDALLKPAGHQSFIYTTVGGGMDFLFKVCIDAGVIVSIPVIVYQALKFIAPVMREDSNKFIAKFTVASGVLALAGLAFGYFIGLPNALHFLLNQFATAQIRPLVTIQAYMSFVMMYMVMSALLLQAPLILLLINRITPLKPGGLMKHERWVILVAFVGAFIMNPTPNLIAQCLVAVPMIVAYHIGVAFVWLANRKGTRPPLIIQMAEQDLTAQRERLEKLQTAVHLTTWQQPEFATAGIEDLGVMQYEYGDEYGEEEDAEKASEETAKPAGESPWYNKRVVQDFLAKSQLQATAATSAVNEQPAAPKPARHPHRGHVMDIAPPPKSAFPERQIRQLPEA